MATDIVHLNHKIKADKRQICWSDCLDQEDWEAREDNSAGSIYLDGNIIGMQEEDKRLVIRTTKTAYELRYCGHPFYFGVHPVCSYCLGNRKDSNGFCSNCGGRSE